MMTLKIYRRFCLALTILLSVCVMMEVRAQAPTDSPFYAVSYIEVMPSGRAMLVGAFKQYRDASGKEDGFVRFELVEQAGRPGHFILVETWRDQKALEAHGMSAHVKQFRDVFQSARVSGYDQRPYRPVTVSSGSAAGGGQTVYVISHVDIGGGIQFDSQGMLRRLADASRKDRGCLRFDILQNTVRMNHFTVIEVWENQQALDAHAAAPHTKQYRDDLQPVSGSPVDERVLKAVE
jgi:quinol monooxygenase YgiN